MREPFISIVIPVYNLENYIEDCLGSICAQKFQSYEVLIINDGSTDSSQERIENFIKDKINFRILTKKNQGVSAARNFGIENSRGKYLWFVDGDDMLQPNALEQLSQMANAAGEVDVLGFNYDFFGIHDLGQSPDKTEFLKPINGSEFFKHYQRLAVWSFLYNRNFLFDNKIRFIENVKIFEDNLFNIDVFNSAKKIIQKNSKLYLYRQNRVDSAMQNKKYVELLPSFYKVFRHLNNIKPKFFNREDVEIAKLSYWLSFTYYFRKSIFQSKKEKLKNSALLYEAAGAIAHKSDLRLYEKFDLTIYNRFKKSGMFILETGIFSNIRKAIVKIDYETKKDDF